MFWRVVILILSLIFLVTGLVNAEETGQYPKVFVSKLDGPSCAKPLMNQSQAQSQYWIKTFGYTNTDDTAEAIITLSDGNIVITGESNRDILIMELDNNGLVIWQRTYDNNGKEDTGESIFKVSEGYLIIVESEEENSESYLILKIGEDGTILSSKEIQSDGELGLISEENDGYLIGGVIYNGIDYDGVIFKITKDLSSILWQVKYGTSGHEGFTSILKLTDGYIGVGVYDVQFDRDGEIISAKIWVVKIDNNGNFVWQKDFGFGMAEKVIQTSDGGFIIGALGMFNEYDIMLIKLDSNGNIIWAKSYDSGGDENELMDMVMDGDGNVVVVGESEISDNSNGVILKVDSSGNIIWQKYFDSGYDGDEANGVVLSGTDYIVAGRYGQNNNDIILAKIDANGEVNDPFCGIYGNANFQVTDRQITPQNTLAQQGSISINLTDVTLTTSTPSLTEILQCSSCTPPFSDIPCDFWAITEITWAKERGITKGYPDGTYRPLEPITRDAMAAFIVRALFGDNPICEGGIPCENTEPYFRDVDQSQPFFRHIQKLYEVGITKGWPDGTYRPYENIRRDAMAAFLIRALGYGDDPVCSGGVPCDQTQPYFMDVDPTHPFYKHIQKLKETGITGGCRQDPPMFCPDSYVTRDAMAVFLYRAFRETTLSGTAATGKALASTAIYLKDAKGNIRSTITDVNGKFSFDTTYLTPPFYLRTQGFGLFSYTEQKNGTANITPLTTTVVAIANNGDPDIYNNPPTQLNLDNAKSSLKTFLDPVLQKYNVQDVDFITSPFEANGQGMDRILDTILISVNQDIQTIEIKNPFTGETIGIGTFANGSIAITDPITTNEVNNLVQSPIHRKYFIYIAADGPAMMDIIYDVDGKISVTITATEGDTGDIFFVYGSGQKTGNSITFTASVILCRDKCENEQDPNCNIENNRGTATFTGTIDSNGNISGTFINTLSLGFVCEENNSNVYEGTFSAEDVTDALPVNIAGVYDGYARPEEWGEEGPYTIEISQFGNKINVSITGIDSDTGQPFTRTGEGIVYGNYMIFRVPIILCHDTNPNAEAEYATFFGKFDSSSNTIRGIYGDGVPDGDYCKSPYYDETGHTSKATGFWRAVRK